MLLSMITYDYTPSLDTTQLLISLLDVGLEGTQADCLPGEIIVIVYSHLKCSLKLSHSNSRLSRVFCVRFQVWTKIAVSKPGEREDNAVLQYRGDMVEADIQSIGPDPL